MGWFWTTDLQGWVGRLGEGELRRGHPGFDVRDIREVWTPPPTSQGKRGL